MNCETVARDFNDAVAAALAATCPKVQRRAKLVPWWSGELWRLKRGLNVSRRRYQRCGPGQVREARRAEYQEQKQQYFLAIKDSKRRSWELFVQNNMNENPYGLAYKLGAESSSYVKS